jgi:hypothetical protein
MSDENACAAVKNDREPHPTWYQRPGWQFGSMKLHVSVSVLYLSIALLPLAQYLHAGYKVPNWPTENPTLLFFWAAFVALAYPVWAWREAGVFERWVRELPEQQRKAERAYFSLHAALAKNFWAAVLAIYTVAGLVGIALKPGLP